jgi:hypothetical protein
VNFVDDDLIATGARGGATVDDFAHVSPTPVLDAASISSTST